jgi:hypothetical protein
MRFGGIAPVERKLDAGEEPVREEDGHLSVNFTENILKWHAEAIGRCAELTPASDV